MEAYMSLKELSHMVDAERGGLNQTVSHVITDVLLSDFDFLDNLRSLNSKYVSSSALGEAEIRVLLIDMIRNKVVGMIPDGYSLVPVLAKEALSLADWEHILECLIYV